MLQRCWAASDFLGHTCAKVSRRCVGCWRWPQGSHRPNLPYHLGMAHNAVHAVLSTKSVSRQVCRVRAPSWRACMHRPLLPGLIHKSCR